MHAFAALCQAGEAHKPSIDITYRRYIQNRARLFYFLKTRYIGDPWSLQDSKKVRVPV